MGTLRGDGHKLPPFIIKHTSPSGRVREGRKTAPGEKAAKGMTADMNIKYLNFLRRHVKKRSILIWDRLSSHRSQRVLNHAKSLRFKSGRRVFRIYSLPPKAGFLINPLDYSFYGLFKPAYWKLDRSTPELKFSAAHQAYNSISSDSVAAMFRDCGITSTEPEGALTHRIYSMVCEGVREEHEDALDLYDGWKSGALAVEGASPYKRRRLEPPQQLPTAHLDGSYWAEW